MAILISRETGGDQVPPELFARLPSLGVSLPAQPTLMGDRSIKSITSRMAAQLSVPLIENHYSSALINVAKPPKHRSLYPPHTRTWPQQARQLLVDTIHAPYRTQLRQRVIEMLRHNSCVVHLAVSTFQAVNRKGKPRRTDAGLLYDPGIEAEANFCIDWLEDMFYEVEMLRVRRNYPWRGTRDSVTRSLRAEFSKQGYLGIELVLNRSWASRDVQMRDIAIDGVCESLQEICVQTQQEAA